MTIQQLPVYTGEIPALGQEQSQFNTNVSDKLAYDAQLVPAQNTYATEANALASQVQSDASDAESSADAAAASASGLGYQGLWPDTGGSANKGDTYQTQVSGTPTGQYFTALQNTTVDPVGDDVNWRVVVGANDIGSGNSLLSGGNIWPLSIQDALPLDAQSSNIPENISRLTIATENGDSGNELLYLWEPSGDFGSTTHTVTNIAANSTAGYDVTTNQGTFEFLTLVRHAARNAHDPFGWGANGNDTGDDSVAINAMVAEFGFMNLLDKTYRISNPIQVLPSSIGTKWSGMGAEKSILNCVGMGATNAIQLSNPDVFMRLTMMDFGIQGDADRGINLTVNPVGGFQVFDSIFQNLVLSTTRQSLYIPKEFSNTYIN